MNYHTKLALNRTPSSQGPLPNRKKHKTPSKQLRKAWAIHANLDREFLRAIEKDD